MSRDPIGAAPTLDVSELPLHGEGTASQTWWGNLAFMLIEGSGFALVIAVYFYLQSIAPTWPIGAPPPDLGPGTWLTGVLLLSLVPNHFMAKWAKAKDLRDVRFAIVTMTLLAIVPLVLRAYEFPALNVSWDTNAYGSVVWLLLGLHTTHLLTDLVESLVLVGVMFSKHGDNARRFGDIVDNSVYWVFVVVAWLLIYGCIYWVPRL
jgi:cytochrome c oxidase subunit 3